MGFWALQPIETGAGQKKRVCCSGRERCSRGKDFRGCGAPRDAWCYCRRCLQPACSGRCARAHTFESSFKRRTARGGAPWRVVVENRRHQTALKGQCPLAKRHCCLPHLRAHTAGACHGSWPSAGVSLERGLCESRCAAHGTTDPAAHFAGTRAEARLHGRAPRNSQGGRPTGGAATEPAHKERLGTPPCVTRRLQDTCRHAMPTRGRARA